jgi:hypothetical protein
MIKVDILSIQYPLLVLQKLNQLIILMKEVIVGSIAYPTRVIRNLPPNRTCKFPRIRLSTEIMLDDACI